MGYIKVEVEDNGVGISQENQKKLFKLFGFISDTKSMNKKGIGLGLAISKKIINQFGGEIRVRSEVNEGTTFIFNMMLEDEAEFFKEHIVLNMDSESEEDVDYIERASVDNRMQSIIKAKTPLKQIEEVTEIAGDDLEESAVKIAPANLLNSKGQDYIGSEKLGRFETAQ